MYNAASVEKRIASSVKDHLLFNQQPLPENIHEFMTWTWAQIEPYMQDLLNRDLTQATLTQFLTDWSALGTRLSETYGRLYVATTLNTTDEDAENRFKAFLDTIIPPTFTYGNQLDQKLLDSGLKPEGFEIPLRNMQADVELFREENVPLHTEVSKLTMEHDKVTGTMTVMWEGEELPLPKLGPILQGPDRAKREAAWRLELERRLQDRETLNTLWGQYLTLRRQIADNADMSDFRAYQWRALKRFDYSPQDAEQFHAAIEQVVVPAAKRIYERRRAELGVDKLRPWDGDHFTKVELPGREPLQPFTDVAELIKTSEAIFQQVDPVLGDYFTTMAREGLLDLDSRMNKAPGGYCNTLEYSKRPFIFMNAVGRHDDVQTLLHEAGHAFHAFETTKLPYLQQQNVPTEFCEVASMAMELLAAPYLTAANGGFYSETEAARARVEHLEQIILFWPYMAVVDAFQHWVYTNPDAAAVPANCDAKWSELWDRFIVGPDWTGFETEKATGWQRKLHIFQVPFYYIEYGLAQLGAVQVWANALEDQAGAVAAYRRALALGGTVGLPELFAAAGAKFAFDAPTLQKAVDLVERTIAELTVAG